MDTDSCRCTALVQLVSKRYWIQEVLSLLSRQRSCGIQSAILRLYARWKLLPPELTYLLYDKTGLRLAPDFELEGIEGIQSCDFLNLDLAAELAFEVNQVLAPAASTLRLSVCDQGPGDCLFVPSGWHHVVHNLTDVLSINENWINAFNVKWTWELVKQTYLHAQNQLSDLRLCWQISAVRVIWSM